ncbi:MAG: hypothetical protein CW691_03265 [Candidatus Bathyarchaeum sp.]|nr:MAG: hypothetical protein CW691_03265 [Candidatus Bathyarchaeum sp.]
MLIVLTIITLLITSIGALGIFSNQRLAASFEQLEDYELKVDVAAEASSYAKRAEGHAFLYLTLGNELDKEKFFDRHGSLEEQITILEKEVECLESLEQLDYLKSFSGEVLEYGNQLIETYDQNPEEFDFKEQTELVLKFHDASSGARKAAVSIVVHETEELNRNVEKAENFAIFLQQGTGIIMGVLIPLTIVMGITVSRSISKPIEKLRAVAVEIGNGKLGLQNDVKSKNEIGDLADSLNKMSRRLKANQEEILEAERNAARQTATWVGHDLRNPLQAIQYGIYRIDKKISRLPSSSATSQEIKAILENIENSVEYADKIVNNLKDYGSKQKPEQTKTDVNALLKKVLSQVSPSKNIEIIEIFGEIPDITVDKNMMERVFINLATNGIQAMQNGGKLKVYTKKTTDFVEVSFQDSGEGIPQEIMNKIFEPFFTTKAKGMGVGLSISKRFVESNGGTITVKSEEGMGSTFTVKLPIKNT